MAAFSADPRGPSATTTSGAGRRRRRGTRTASPTQKRSRYREVSSRVLVLAHSSFSGPWASLKVVSVLGGLAGLWLRQRSPVWRGAAWVLALVGPLLVTLASVPFRSLGAVVAFLFGTLLVVVVIAVIGGMWPALTAVAVGILARATLLSHPAHSGDVHANLVSLTLFTVVGIALSVLIGTLGQLAQEQAALRRVATLVAHTVPAEELFAAVTEEVGRLVGAVRAGVARYDSDDSLTSVKFWSKTGEQFPTDS